MYITIDCIFIFLCLYINIRNNCTILPKLIVWWKKYKDYEKREISKKKKKIRVLGIFIKHKAIIIYFYYILFFSTLYLSILTKKKTIKNLGRKMVKYNVYLCVCVCVVARLFPDLIWSSHGDGPRVISPAILLYIMDLVQ